mmetsp:Transcript_30097/g.39628  ORF Transcript_30097/g.39628 Transcript_30097/m.39628 type:complete len:302 (+) Transcript_30097:139-1044(+)|eukprot:CAMPEP_0117771004 /NCGR_PEP_ID=MMETSP0947-20121206/24188_1 /TAXON_ID=44440 /ORGANISM="Chattonella subsalsa, Strain CCMP2191" /LENGTH=301 /DNA_ID=CAMNT_0005596245 /DNA_START=1191 /DNA_END=2096 /DNA_ORIENTATION=+
MRLSLLSWNIWFDQLGQTKRFNTILEKSLALKPDVICFQEVVPDFIRLAMNTPGLLEEYEISDDGSGSSVSPYGVLMMVKNNLKPEFAFHEMATNMYRQLLTAKLGAQDVFVGTVHLESLNQHPYREAQLQLAKDVLDQCENSILCGDFNFCSYRNFVPKGKLENESLKEILPEYTDIWPLLRPEEKGYTYDSENNVMIHRYERMRYDRIVAKLSSGLSVVSVELIGTDKIINEESKKSEDENAVPKSEWDDESYECPAEFHCSDHFGLFAEFLLDDNKKRKVVEISIGEANGVECGDNPP